MDWSLQGQGSDASAVRLSSHFQPIFSLAHRAAVGFEGLVRGAAPDGKQVLPVQLFARAPRGEARIRLDRECRELHVRNFLRVAPERRERSWLFMNVDPYVATEGTRFGSFFAAMLERHGMAPARVAIELIESRVSDEERLATAVEYYRELGCLIVIDDFGAGHSNFDRIWRLRPDIVKLDRDMTRRAAVEPLGRRMFSGIVQLLHEAGALVCVEGIETEAEALAAIDADADMVQGYYFARPAPLGAAPAEDPGVFGRLFADFRAGISGLQDRRLAALEPFTRALAGAAMALAGGAPLARAARPLLEMESAQRCFVISEEGSQVGPNLEAARNRDARDPRLEPMQPGPETNWQTRPYFRRAIEAPGKIQVSRPYMSLTGPKLCLTLSIAFQTESGVHVLCADLDFEALAGEDLAFGAVRRPS